MSSKPRSGKQESEPVTWSRYGGDLAYSLKRMNDLEHEIHALHKLMAEIALQVSARQRGETAGPRPAQAVQRGNCRIIRFLTTQIQ